jgi:DNA polymerase-3 subunit epsilon
MTAWWQGTLATLDTETTGTDVENDRIVTAVLDVYDSAETCTESLHLLLDPGIEIPAEAEAVHGISTQRARDEGTDSVTGLTSLLAAIVGVWDRKIPLVVYNAAFDLTLIDRELRRHLDTPLVIAGPVIDPMVIDRQVDRYVKGTGQRQLGPTCARYGIEITDWHTAEADAYAAQAVARRMGEKHDAVMPGTLQDLWRWQVGLRRDQAADLQNYFARVGKTNDDGTPIIIDGQWPMIAREAPRG